MAENLPAGLPVNARHLGAGVDMAVQPMWLDRIWKKRVDRSSHRRLLEKACNYYKYNNYKKYFKGGDEILSGKTVKMTVSII